ncbi:MAG: biopolymer transporter ExbD [Bacteroidales bacterium]|nr:biopolymer transporter ExbD [Bacteroidales bacterium]
MRKKRRSPEVNAGSMADIAFQLLIFFLVSTTMDTDKGLLRKLPPMPDPNMQEETKDVKERNVFLVLVNRNNQLLVENQQMNIRDLREAAKEFIENPYNDPDLPVKEPIDVPYFGEVMVTKYHVISLQNDRGTSYGTYMAVQNELTAAYNELKDQLAKSRFNVKYDDLKEDDPRREAIDDIYPLKISEAEPRNVGGTR